MNTFSLEYVESLYSEYLRDPAQVEPAWRKYFEDFLAAPPTASNGAPATARKVAPRKSQPPPTAATPAAVMVPSHGTRPQRVLDVAQLQDRVDQLIRGYRVRGHMMAKLDPLGIPRPGHVELDPESYGLSSADLDRQFSTVSIHGPSVLTLGGILQRLQNTYCRSIGAQFMHIDDRSIRDWLQTRMEGSENRLDLSAETQTRILTRLTDAVIFEGFVRKKFVGAKTFSLEGAESLIPLLDLALEKAGEHGLKEIVLGMAHRGRLNVLANIMHKRAKNIFWEFDDPHPELHRGGGDVRYHMGYSSDWTTSAGRRLHLSLCFNPSHLEYVNPVALGRTRSKQARVGDDRQHKRSMAILIHGDAAFAGQGIVQETLNLSQLDGYKIGGTLHVIVNNQLGFTTPPDQGRSTYYASDVAKMLQIPIFHVNGEDPEAVAQVVNLAMDFRREFERDVVIDMYCYRRWGHNEGDEPRFTQPLVYHAVDKRQSVRDGYLEHLLELGEITRDDAEKIAEQRSRELEEEFEEAKAEAYTPDTQTLGGVWEDYLGGLEPDDDPDTGLDRKRLAPLLLQLSSVPEGFHLHRKLQRFFKQREEMAAGDAPLDWATAEILALGSLAIEGHRVRLSGQDSARGTFSQRHAVLHDTKNGETYMPLEHLGPDQAPVEIINSPLSESGVLGFEYGFSLDYPEALVAWEAQFGDFWNVAQVIVDQFITSAEDKWRRLSGLVMLLPHGLEGQGPEHASARLERFLMLTAEHNIQVVVPSTPAQYFHVLRRQVKRRWRKPLIVMTPKSLLRHPRVVSDLDELASGRFQRVIADAPGDAGAIDRVLLCTGKIYYELLAEREERGRDDVAIIRLEQLYPLPEKELYDALASFRDGTPVVWVQEEPANMGAWQFLRVKFGDTLDDRFPFSRVSRPESASPSTGSHASHKLEQQDLLTQAFSEAGSLVGK